MDTNFDESVAQIVRRDGRYHADAYEFVNAAVTYTVKKLARDSKPRGARHISAEELLAGAMDYAVTQFGFLAAAVIRQWGILSGEDFGNIVYNMIDAHLLSASKEDSQSDFLCRPFLADELQQEIDAGLKQSPPPDDPPVLDD